MDDDMPRIRTVKPELFLDEKLFDAEEASGLPVRLGFIGLFCNADRAGRFKWRPRQLGATILPYDGVQFTKVMDALEAAGCVQRYSVDGEEYGCIPSWGDHQQINNREAESKLPPPPGWEAPEPEAPAKVKKPGVAITALEAIWADYPRKVGKAKAITAMRNAVNGGKITADELHDHVREFAQAVNGWQDDRKKFVPHCTTWVNQERWTDDRSEWQARDDDQGRHGMAERWAAARRYVSKWVACADGVGHEQCRAKRKKLAAAFDEKHPGVRGVVEAIGVDRIQANDMGVSQQFERMMGGK